MGMDLSQYEQDYVGPVKVEVTGAKEGKTGRGTPYFQLNLKVVEPAAGYDLDMHKDPTNFTLRDMVWMPTASDDTDKAAGKGNRLRRMCIGFGFDGDVLPDAEDFLGCEAIATLQLNEDGEPEVNFNRYKAV